MGLTVACRRWLRDSMYLPSEPVTVTAVALVAVTVRAEELPALIEAGFAAMVTVGAAGGTTVTVQWPLCCLLRR